MTELPRIARLPSVCPHDCPSACSLEVEVIDGRTIGRVRGNKRQSYTDGVICAKVARYAERIHHPDRLLHPLRRTGPKGSGAFERISWDEALDEIARRFLAIEAEHGAEAVWPYYYAGTMGLVMRDGINRLRHAKRYSGQFSTICTTTAWTGFIAGTGRLAGPDPREMAKSDCVVIWGTNPVHTQVNVMHHAVKARKERGAKIVAIDIYRNATLDQADLPLVLKPGTDGALACAVMHVLFRDGHADRDYLARFADAPEELEAHLSTRTPEWAAAITGLSVAEIEEFATLIGTRKKSFFRLGYGFARQRNGVVNIHAASCIPTVTGAWQYEGGGAFHSNSGIYKWRKGLIEGLDKIDRNVRQLDQSQIGRVLTGDAQALRQGGPVKALFIQNTNPVTVAPEQELVKRGFASDDLFTVVHEQFMTETAQMADIVLPATQFMEHDDLYQGGGHQHIMWGGKLVDPPGECRSNHEVICALAQRLGAEHRGFAMTPREIVDWTLQETGRGTLEELVANDFIDIQPDFETAHYLKGFGWPGGKFRFKPDWTKVPNSNAGLVGPHETLPSLPDHWAVIEAADAEHPFRLATSPARNFLNSSFTETPTSQKKEGAPTLMLHPADAAALGIAAGDHVTVGNRRGSVELDAVLFDGLVRGVAIAESIWPNGAHRGGRGINTITGADSPAPYGGAAFHDNKVWIRKAV
ncbi:Dehydrogenase [Bosea sp. 62]|uniref:molybdopterin-dependent oxidoreductase n=1 Tax=unclassified Bosea (in: a-proteobacteria) TaxID=2653178 RepID=UPI001259B6F3|nr:MULTISPECIES: molybdopterin-dependent oxidoreductase [unclassified Bosea (in: a-proteobacteria)]CAD5256249.1 Dehydrogenase [Bosea sp. 46]CAD5260298.1 Dehydrogenase [Bosea sp. 21B]CAD5280349.1 Dehydrogenase [Bosea sp. 7B]VVT58233.1 Dehydrogenase [Bosea sp. EC-HK365B]VXB49345.1 Dehydrogenase [Bosea sp. 29B]